MLRNNILRGGFILVLPASVFLLIFFLTPLYQMLLSSLTNGLDSYVAIFENSIYLRVFWNTINISLIVTLVCLLAGYVFSYLMYISGNTVRLFLLAIVLLPFWSSLLVRTFAWIALLQDTGLINSFLLYLGWIDQPLHLIRSYFGISAGMVHIMLPFMILPLYASMLKIDKTLLKAATSLGAPPFQVFLRIFFPLSLPGVIAGALLVFTVSLGFYITPALLGSPRQMMMGELIATEIEGFDLPTASALGLLLLAATLLVMIIFGGLLSRRSGQRG